jgi:hypothetical protein
MNKELGPCFWPLFSKLRLYGRRTFGFAEELGWCIVGKVHMGLRGGIMVTMRKVWRAGSLAG